MQLKLVKIVDRRYPDFSQKPLFSVTLEVVIDQQHEGVAGAFDVMVEPENGDSMTLSQIEELAIKKVLSSL